MTLEEAIRHHQEVADLCEHIAETFPEDGPADVLKCAEKAEEHRQLVKWLEELQTLRSHFFRYQEITLTHAKTGQREDMLIDVKTQKILAYWMTAELAISLGHTWEVDDGT